MDEEIIESTLFLRLKKAQIIIRVDEIVFLGPQCYSDEDYEYEYVVVTKSQGMIGLDVDDYEEMYAALRQISGNTEPNEEDEELEEENE